MQTFERGTIHTPERARQLKDFAGLCFGNITPTDIDGLIEYHGQAYVLLELKLKGVTVLQGQHLALERLTDDLERSKKPTLCIIAEHEVADCHNTIVAANAIVLEYRYYYQWREPRISPTSVHSMVERFISSVDQGQLGSRPDA